MEGGKIQVTLGDGSVHQMEPRDVALLLQNCVINIPSTSKAALDVFTKFIEREKVNSDDNEERYRLLMDSIDNADSLSHLIQLPYKSGQQKLLDLCRKRAVILLKGPVTALLFDDLEEPFAWIESPFGEWR